MRLSLLLAVAVCVGCNRSDSGPVWVGHVEPPHHEDEARAVRLAVEELNKDSGRQPQGRRVQVRGAPGGTPEEWGAQATRLIALNGVRMVIVADRYADVERVGLAVQAGNVLAMSPGGWPGSPAPQNLFAVGISPSERGRLLAAAVKRSDGKRPAVLILRDPAAKAANLAADRFAADCRAFADVVADTTVSADKKPGAEVVFFACPARQAVQARAGLNEDTQLLFGDEDAELPALLAEGQRANGMTVAAAFHPDARSERLTAFAQRYEQEYKQPPTVAAVLAHDALTVWVEAVRRAGGFDTKAVRDELLKRETPFEVLTGTLTFADDHTARRPAFVAQVQNGKLGPATRHDP
jgi:ABC-type branched-subunit amino acid transport system substrate-binding protein